MAKSINDHKKIEIDNKDNTIRTTRSLLSKGLEQIQNSNTLEIFNVILLPLSSIFIIVKDKKQIINNAFITRENKIEIINGRKVSIPNVKLTCSTKIEVDSIINFEKENYVIKSNSRENENTIFHYELSLLFDNVIILDNIEDYNDINLIDNNGIFQFIEYFRLKDIQAYPSSMFMSIDKMKHKGVFIHYLDTENTAIKNDIKKDIYRVYLNRYSRNEVKDLLEIMYEDSINGLLNIHGLMNPFEIKTEYTSNGIVDNMSIHFDVEYIYELKSDSKLTKHYITEVYYEMKGKNYNDKA